MHLAESDVAKDPSADLRFAMQLSLISGVGPKVFADLIEQFGSPQAALAAGPAALQQVPGVGTKLARAIVSAESFDEVDSAIALCAKNSIAILQRGHENYPKLLFEIYDPPNLLYVQGKLEPVDELAIAIVGSRHATNYGLTQAEKLARGLSLAGLTIVSGLARGIDQAAHRGALAAGGRTIAVLGGGVLNIYPPENAGLSKEVRNQGALISEAHPMSAPKSGSFPQRNRIISGMCLGVIIVEAAQKSGALITARLGNEQGREVFAVPGRVDSRLSVGCHRLIRDGAKLVQTVDDVLEELGPLATPIRVDSQQVMRNPAELKLNEQETAVLQAIDTHPTDMDTIVSKSGLPIARVLSTISVLEIRRLVRRLSGSTLIRL